MTLQPSPASKQRRADERPPSDESALLSRLRTGEASAFEELVRTQGGRLLTVARRLLRCEEDARDAVQESFLAASRSLARFEGGCRLSTWLHRIVVNTALMKLRTRRRRPEESIEELLPGFLEDGHHAVHQGEWAAPAHELLERSETRALVRQAIDGLPESYRTVLLLRDIEELDTSEVAELMGLSPNAVKTRLHRARQALRGLLHPRFAGGAA